MKLKRMKSQTFNVWILSVVGALIFPPEYVGADEAKLTLSELRSERKQMAQRKRRIIYNNDGDDLGVGVLLPTHPDWAC